MAPKGNFKSTKQHSGTPGLIQRSNGQWACKVNFSKAEQEAWFKVRKERKRYIQRSLFTDSLELARLAHPETLMEIRREISQVMVASGNLDELSPAQRMKYGVGGVYQGLVNPSSSQASPVPPPDGLAEMAEQVTSASTTGDNPELLVSRQRELQQAMNRGMAIALLREQGIDATPENLSLAEQSLAFAIEQASETLSDRTKRGVFAVESDGHKQLTEAAESISVTTPNGLTIWDLFELYKQHHRENDDAVNEKRERLTREWVEFIGGDSIELLNSQNLVKYHGHLADLMYSNRASGKTGPLDLKTEAGVNRKASHLQLLTKVWNEVNAGDPDKEIPPLHFRKLKQSEAAKKEAKLRERTKATTDDAKLALLGQALTEAENPGPSQRPSVLGARIGTWKGLLLLDNTPMRRCEVATLRWENVIQFQGVWCLDITTTKTAAGIRRIPLNETLRRVLLPLKEKVNDPQAFIVDNFAQANKIPADKLTDWLRSRAEELGIGDRVNPHSWRHDAGGDLGVTAPEGVKRALLGHAGGVTQRYWSENLPELQRFVEVLGTKSEPLIQRMEALVKAAPDGPHPFAVMGRS